MWEKLNFVWVVISALVLAVAWFISFAIEMTQDWERMVARIDSMERQAERRIQSLEEQECRVDTWTVGQMLAFAEEMDATDPAGRIIKRTMINVLKSTLSRMEKHCE